MATKYTQYVPEDCAFAGAASYPPEDNKKSEPDFSNIPTIPTEKRILIVANDPPNLKPRVFDGPVPIQNTQNAPAAA